MKLKKKLKKLKLTSRRKPFISNRRNVEKQEMKQMGFTSKKKYRAWQKTQRPCRKGE